LTAKQLVLPLIDAAQATVRRTLAATGDRAPAAHPRVRDALHRVLDKLQFGQVLLATVGSTAPFVGLLGTVWGIYHALTRHCSASGRSASTRCPARWARR
jgi:biopolymer transport protein ExbB